MPFVLARELGFFREEGLEVTMENFPSGAKATQALIGGSADVAVINYVHNVQVAAEGQRIRAGEARRAVDHRARDRGRLNRRSL